MCGKGVNQSPINLTGFIESELDSITFNYNGLATEILNNGHSIQANYSAGSTMSVPAGPMNLSSFISTHQAKIR